MSRQLLITAGPTHEPIDRVRYIANRSSGRMGIALAYAARDVGWNVTLLLGPVALDPPNDVQVQRFESTADLAHLLDQNFPACDVLIMAAAVADYRPCRVYPAKMPRKAAALVLELESTPDLVAACAARRRADQYIVGFALEEESHLEARALDKLKRKGLDAIVANPLDTMGAVDICATIYSTGAPHREQTIQQSTISTTKTRFADRLIAWLDSRVESSPGNRR